MIRFLALITFASFCTLSLAQQTPPLTSPQAADTEVQLAAQRIASAVNAEPIDSPGQVVVVYFTPRDRNPAANHVQRIQRITEETAAFYQRELLRHGFKHRVMNVRRNDQGQVDVIDANFFSFRVLHRVACRIKLNCLQ